MAEQQTSSSNTIYNYSPYQIVKGSMQLFDIRTRRRSTRLEFQYNPATIQISQQPSYSFLQAPVSRRSFAQYSHHEPLQIDFVLNFFQTSLSDVSDQLKQLNDFIDPAGGIPPLVELQLAGTLKHLNRNPKGVITSSETTITQQDRYLNPTIAEVSISFRESHIAGYQYARS